MLVDQKFFHPLVIHQSTRENNKGIQNSQKYIKSSIHLLLISLTFQSPVWKIMPSPQRSTKPQQSGIEWVTRMGSTSKGPAWNLFLILKTLSLDERKIPNSFKRFFISCPINNNAFQNSEDLILFMQVVQQCKMAMMWLAIKTIFSVTSMVKDDAKIGVVESSAGMTY